MDRHFDIADEAGVPLADRPNELIFVVPQPLAFGSYARPRVRQRGKVSYASVCLTEMPSIAMILPACMALTLDNSKRIMVIYPSFSMGEQA